MPTIIKGSQRDIATQGVAFNFDDLQEKANAYLQKVRTAADQILNAARDESSKLRKEAKEMINEARLAAVKYREEAENESHKSGFTAGKEEGYQEGLKQGLEEAEKRVQKEISEKSDTRFREQLAPMVPRFETATQQVVGELERMKHEWTGFWESCARDVILAIAERVIRQELERRPEIVLDLIREALELATGSAQVTVRINKEDHERFATEIEGIVGSLQGMARVEVVADETIEAGGCRIDTTHGTIDQQISSQLQRIEEELR